MKSVRLIGALTILTACAADSIAPGRPDLRGVWHVFDPRMPRVALSDFTISQSGESVVIRWLPAFKPDIVTYEGTFENNTVIDGRQLDTRAPEANRWTPLKITVTDLNHIELDAGVVLKRASPQDAAVFGKLRRMSLEKLPAAPFDLSGTWSFENRLQVFVTKDGGDIVLKTEREGQIFRGRYFSNPVIAGAGLRRDASGTLRPGEAELMVVDPDHLSYLGKVMYRQSSPAARDIPCDADNAYHMKDYYAHARAMAAYSQKDYKTAVCWLTIAADWDYGPAQSMLAAMLIDGKDGGAPDYARAFGLASKSAQAGDVAGQYMLASLYSQGKGVAANPEKAQFWLNKAKETQAFANMMQAITPERLAKGLSVLNGLMDWSDFDMSMTPPSCFSRDVLGNRNAQCH